MAGVLPPTDEMLYFIAELRADGKSWEAIARQLRKAPRTIRRWRTRYLDRWLPLQVRAERHMANESECESVLVLRNQLRSKDDKLSSLAARALIALRLDLARIDARKPPDPPASRVSPELLHLFTGLDGHSNAELDSIIELIQPRTPAEAPDGGPEPGASPA